MQEHRRKVCVGEGGINVSGEIFLSVVLPQKIFCNLFVSLSGLPLFDKITVSLKMVRHM